MLAAAPLAVKDPNERGEGEAPLSHGRFRRLLGHLVLARTLLGEGLKAGVDGNPVVARPVDREVAARGPIGAAEDVRHDGIGEGQLALGHKRVDVVLLDVLAA